MIAIKKTVRWVLYVFAFLLSLIVIAALVIRFVIFPNIHQYKDDIATFASQKMGQKVLIGDIVTGWDDISPHVELLNVDVFDAENRVALHLNNVEASLSWLSVPMLQPKLTQLLIHNPALTIRRNADGSIYLAGINLAGESKPAFANWLLKQRNVIVENAQIIWQDDLRQAPELSLNQFNLTLTRPILNSLLGQHNFEISSLVSTGSAQKINVSGHFIGHDVSKAKTWHGEVITALAQTELAAFKPWLDYPINIQNGLANAKINLTFGNAQILSVKGNVAISNLALVTKNETTPLVATKFAGDLLWSRLNNTQTFIAQHVQLNTNTGLNIQDGSATYVSSIKNNQPWIKANVRLNQLNLAMLKQIASHIHLPKNILAQLNGFAPVGMLQAVNFNWEGTANKPESYLVNAQFKQLGIQAFQKIPGFSNLTGTLKADEDGGEVILASQNATLDFKDILRWPIPASQLKGDINWKIRQGKALINAKDIFISSPHITGTVNASYDMNGIKGGHLNLTGKFDKGNAKYAPFYYPIILGEDTIHWLDTSILAGRADNVLLTVKGHLADFPFVNSQNKPDNQLGIFKVTAKISDAILHYGNGWPGIDNLNLDLLFEGKRMLLEANSGRISGKKILKSRAEITQLDADWPILHIVSEAEGLVSDGIKFVNESPVQQVTLGFTDNLKTAGRGNLQLTLDIPLEDSEQSKYKGIYKVTNGTIFANAALGLPELTKLNGSLIFNEKGLSANNISAEVLGGPAQFSLNTGADKAIKVVANGRINDAGIKNLIPNAFTNQLSGNTNWAGEIVIKKPLVDFNFRSNLVGLAIDLPPPFNKSASQEISLNVDKKQSVIDKDSININYGQLVSAKILRSLKADQLVFERGDIGINTAAVNPLQSGLSIRGKLEELDADEWLALLSEQSSAQTNVNAPANNKLDLSMLTKADLNVQKLTIFDRSINALKVIAIPNRTGLKMLVDAQEMSGNVEWQDADNGKIIARLKRLTIPSTLTAANKNNAKKEYRKQAQTYPALDIVADNFELGTEKTEASKSETLKLGALALNAFENGEDWVIQKLNITNADSTLSIQGNWHNWTRNPNTSLIVSLNTNNIGKTFSRFGQADTIRGGEAKINGQINWAGSPREFDVTRLDGSLTFEATKGQILKVQPGVGRLFGLVTLQSLPRRLSLDFRDLFSDGFAFDKISATARINSGIVRSDDFFMTGPAAEASIKGETDLKAETQHLTVKVIPHISDSLSLAALAGGPIVGAAAFIAQKILKDPFNKIASSEYVIKGTWDNPIEAGAEKDAVEKPDNKSPLH
ncbi:MULTISPECIES: YhdP family protein [Methylotenera]|uniref:YhdP family protein n=1 Tax=Methylotenera TaxID=359407 RepID=UPI000365C183|nr:MULTISPECIES: YhdP family protein [Methylotenera]